MTFRDNSSWNGVFATLERYRLTGEGSAALLAASVTSAAKLSRCNGAAILIVSENGLSLKAQHGLTTAECGALLKTLDEPSLEHPAVVNQENQYLLTEPLVSPEGMPIGLLVVRDRESHADSAHLPALLKVLARALILELEQTCSREALEHSLRLCHEVLEGLPMMVFVKDIQDDFRFKVWNESAEKITGVPAPACLGKTDFDLFPKEQAVFFRKKDEDTIRTKKTVEISEEPLHTPKGEVILRTKKSVLRDARGRPEFLLGISEDITSVVKAQETIQSQQAQLVRASKLSALGEMAAGVAHEINNPLAIILGKAQQIKNGLRLGKLDSAALVSQLEKIEAMAERIAKIVRGLRSFSRNSDQDALSIENVDQVLADAVTLLSERLRNGGVEVRTPPASGLEIECRPAQVAEILVNLLGNSFDAIQGKDEKWIELSVQSNKNTIEISVTDSGERIPAEIAERMMEPFFTTKPLGKGTGLGLSLSKGLAESNHGTLVYDNQSPHTRFVLSLPMKVKK